MQERKPCRRSRSLGLLVALALGAATPAAVAQTATPAASSAPSATPHTAVPAPATPATKAPPTASPGSSTSQLAPGGAPQTLAPGGAPQNNEIEPNATPTVPGNATTATVDVPARPIVLVAGTSTYDDAFKSIKSSLDVVQAAMAKAGLKATGHPITIFSAPDDKGFKYEVAVPIAGKPATVGDLGGGVTFGLSPAGKGFKFQHRGPYDDIDSTYDVITAYLDAKGLQVDNPYIEEYLGDLTSPDDPHLAVDIYVFEKK